ncbi:hypothetical protein Tco_1270294, partial [Tanacetum coccineum]
MLHEHSTYANIEFIGSSIPHHSEPSVTQAQPITIINPEPIIPQREGKCIATDEQTEDQRKLVKASSTVHPDPDAPILVPYTINGKLFHLTAKQIKAHLDKEEKIRKAEEEAMLFAINKPKDAEHKVLKKQHPEKVRKSLELKKYKYDNYMWTISNRLKPKKITNVKIHLNTKPVVITIFRGTDGRNFEVHNPFAFGNFGISKLDELREIIPRKKNVVVKDLMNSLSRRYERIRKIHEELEIPSALPAPIPQQASPKSSRRKRKHMELEPEIKIPGLECNRALPDNVPFVNNMVIEESEYGIFFTDEFAYMVQSPENARFNMKLKKLIAKHPDQEKL